jgi:uncharacterized protein
MKSTRIAVLLTVLTFSGVGHAATLQDAMRLCKFGYYTSAAPIFETLSSRGDAHAMTWLAWLYDRGYGVERNSGHAAALYRVAAQKGVWMAQINLALKYMSGDGVEKNEGMARQLMQKAGQHANVPPDTAPQLAGGTAIAHDWYGASSGASSKVRKHKTKRPSANRESLALR